MHVQEKATIYFPIERNLREITPCCARASVGELMTGEVNYKQQAGMRELKQFNGIILKFVFTTD